MKAWTIGQLARDVGLTDTSGGELLVAGKPVTSPPEGVAMVFQHFGLLPWKTTANKGLNVLYDGPGVRNPLIASFGLWAVFLVLSEVLFPA